MLEQKNNQSTSPVATPPVSLQREIITMPSEFLVKAATSSRPLLLVLGGMLLLASVVVGIVVILNIASSIRVPTVITPSAPSIEEPVIPEPQDVALVPLVVEEPPLPEIVPVPSSAAEDPDRDGLTNSEEEIFKTDSKNPDTDGDGYNDGDEVKNLFDPTKGSGALLKDSDSMTLFTEPTLQWSLWVPSLWVITQGDVAGSARIATAFPDTFDITHEANPQRVPLDAWVSPQSGSLQSGNITPSTISPRSGNNVLWSVDSLNAYITKPGTDVIYKVIYKTGASEKPYFHAILRMMIESMILP